MMLIIGEETCPYLGLPEDQFTQLTYLSTRHRCYNSKLNQQVTLEHQSFFCMGRNHIACPIYMSPIPASLPAAFAQRPPRFSRRLVLVSSIVVLTVMGFFVLSWWQGWGVSAVQNNDTPAATQSLSVTPTPEVVGDATPAAYGLLEIELNQP